MFESTSKIYHSTVDLLRQLYFGASLVIKYLVQVLTANTIFVTSSKGKSLIVRANL